MLATAYSDIDAAVAAVNNGAIYKYISKPWDQRDLEINLMRAMEFFIIQRERDALFREKISALHRLMMTDRLISLGLLASGISHHLRNALVAGPRFPRPRANEARVGKGPTSINCEIRITGTISTRPCRRRW